MTSFPPRIFGIILFLMFLEACGPGSFFETWSEILSGNESSIDNFDGPGSGPENPVLPKAIKVKNIKKFRFSKVYGVANRDHGLLALRNSGGKTGFSVAAGDVNGDGIEDMLIGAPESDGILKNTTTSGWVYVIFGKKGLPGKIDLKVHADVSLWGGRDSGRNWFGQSLIATDVNGDGLSDLIIGAPHANGIKSEKLHSGAVYIFFGRSRLPRVVNLKKHADVTIFGAESGDLAGFSIAAGDVNGDGRQDLVVGAPGSRGSAPASFRAGKTYVIFGRAKFPKKIHLAKHWNIRIHGVDSSSNRISFSENLPDNSGHKTYAEDVNGDGLDDIIIGAPFGDGFLNRNLDAGETYIVFGRKKIEKEIPLAQRADVTIYGAKDRDNSGRFLTGGDINGDGIRDLVISSPGAKRQAGSGYLNGLIYVLFGRKNWPKSIRLGSKSDLIFFSHHRYLDANIGAGPSGDASALTTPIITQDLNGDGRDDLIVGSPGSKGRAKKSKAGEIDFYVSRSNKKRLLTAAVFQPGKVRKGESFGYSLAQGDIDGDGNADFLVGAPGIFRSRRGGISGGIYVLYGLAKK